MMYLTEDVVVVPNLVLDEERLRLMEILKVKKTLPFKDNPEVMVSSLMNNETYQAIKKYSEICLDIHRKINNTDQIYTTEGFLSHWPSGSFAGEHVDNHSGYEFLTNSSVIYLNDDYEGGEIYFPELGLEYSPRAGDGIFFPCDSPRFVHGVKRITSGDRYTIAMWHTDDKSRSQYA
jgi:hypothetical protein